MATDPMVAGLFATPEMYQQQQDQLAQQQAIQMAQLSPEQRAQADIRGGFQRAGNAIGGLMGAQDPQMKLAAMRQQVLQGLNPNDPNSVAQAAQALAQAGDQAGAAQLAQLARDAAAKGAETSHKMADTALKTVQLSSEGIVSKLLQTGKYTPESIAKFQTTGSSKDLEVIDQTAKPSSEWLGMAKELGLPAARSFNDYTPEQVAAVNQKLFQQSVAKAQAGRATTVFQQEAAFSQELGKLDAKKVTDAVDSRQGAIGLLKAVNELDKLDNSGLISGSFATGRVGLNNFLSTAGLISQEDVKKLANSQQYQKVAGDVILGNLGGKLGSGVSEGDRKFVEGLVPQLETNPLARRELIQYMRNKAADVIRESSRLENYARQNKGLNGYRPEIPLKAPTSSYNPVEAIPTSSPVYATNPNTKERIMSTDGGKTWTKTQ